MESSIGNYLFFFTVVIEAVRKWSPAVDRCHWKMGEEIYSKTHIMLGLRFDGSTINAKT